MRKFQYGYCSFQGNREIISEEYFCINNCGFIKDPLYSEDVEKSRVRQDYMMIYITRGITYTKFDGKIYEAKAGDLLLFKPNTPICHSFQKNSSHFWIHFSGTKAEEILLQSGLTKSGLFHIGTDLDIETLFSEISFKLPFNDSTNKFACTSHLFMIFSKISLSLSKEKTSPPNTRISPALKYMTMNYHEEHNIQFYAQLCNMKESNFKHEFTKITNLSPRSYLISIRMQNAKKSLRENLLSINEIALSVGYDDPLYFSRIFRKYTGTSPSEYRKRYSNSN